MFAREPGMQARTVVHGVQVNAARDVQNTLQLTPK